MDLVRTGIPAPQRRTSHSRILKVHPERFCGFFAERPAIKNPAQRPGHTSGTNHCFMTSSTRASPNMNGAEVAMSTMKQTRRNLHVGSFSPISRNSRSSLIKSVTSSPLVVQGVETRKPRTVGSSRGFRVLVIKKPLKAASLFWQGHIP